MPVETFVEAMKSGNYCNGDKHMSIYITEDGRVLDGLKRLKAAHITNHPITVTMVNNDTTREQILDLLSQMPQKCTCGKRL